MWPRPLLNSWHPPSMELVTVAPRAQPMTHGNMQKAKSYIVLVHLPPCGLPTICAVTPQSPPPPLKAPPPFLCSLCPFFGERLMLCEMSPQNMANPNGEMFCNMASTSCSRLGTHHDAVPTMQWRRTSFATVAQFNGTPPRAFGC